MKDNSSTGFESQTFELEAADGRKIAAIVTAERGRLTENIPVVVVPPAAGKVMRHSLQVALTLAKNGLKVYRYDSLDHPGVSDGEMRDFTMSSALTSLRAVVKEVCRREKVGGVTVVASSLAMRVTIRAAVAAPAIERVIGLVGTVDLQKTLHAVFGVDVFCAPDLPEAMSYESFTISSRPFVRDALDGRWQSLETTIEDLRRIEAPVVNIISEKDTWVRVGDVQRALELGYNGPRQIFVIPEGVHELKANPAALRILLRKLAQLMKGAEDSPVQLPRFSELIAENDIERRLFATPH